LHATVNISQAAFEQHGLADAWDRVLAVVVQPGVEFGAQTIDEYQRDRARDLCRALRDLPSLVFEGHSTDYQQARHLRQMVEDGVAILKVGPALTFAMREALFLLSYIEQELEITPASDLIAVLDDAMLRRPRDWQLYYQGTDQEQRFLRKYSLSDRSRYYWAEPAVQQAVQHLLRNLEAAPIPLPLLSQFFPQQYDRIRAGRLANTPRALITARIQDVLHTYASACFTA
jgi:D-tagatose-1,6-bisphosphate aldolase subunit GatZ/KbaZ